MVVHFACPTISSVPHYCAVSTFHRPSQYNQLLFFKTNSDYIIFEICYLDTSKLALFFFFFNFYLFIYFWLCWVFVSVRGLSLVVASGGHSSSRCVGLSLSRPLLLWSTGSRHAGSVIMAHGPSCSTACGIFPDQGSNPCPLHWQADSQPLRHQGSPCPLFLKEAIKPLVSEGALTILIYPPHPSHHAPVPPAPRSLR